MEDLPQHGDSREVISRTAFPWRWEILRCRQKGLPLSEREGSCAAAQFTIRRSDGSYAGFCAIAIGARFSHRLARAN